MKRKIKIFLQLVFATFTFIVQYNYITQLAKLRYSFSSIILFSYWFYDTTIKCFYDRTSVPLLAEKPLQTAHFTKGALSISTGSKQLTYKHLQHMYSVGTSDFGTAISGTVFLVH
jgi:hypothetical protein